MIKKIAVCPGCHSKISCEGEPGQKVTIKCSQCGKKGIIAFSSRDTTIDERNLVELECYPVFEPFVFIKILKDTTSLDKFYKAIEPQLNEKEKDSLNFIQETLLNSIDIRLDELDNQKVDAFLLERITNIVNDYNIIVDEVLKNKILYYIKRDFVWYGKIDPLMRDPNIEDISCDGSGLPIFLFHRKYGSLKSNIQFSDEVMLSEFVVRLAQKCGKHISIAEPMLDATMPDGSRIQMTLSKEVTAKGSTFTIRRFKADPITATDLISYKSLSAEMVAYLWLAVENGISALIAGGTAAGKTSTLNAICLFIPRESKIVSIEETREINLPHPNWIPGVVRSGFGEIINDKLAGEIDLYDLMKAALRQRPEYILVGEIRGKEAYVLFQAMATGHTTYSTFHADSAQSLIHRLEGKPIEIPRVMLQSLNIVTIQIQTEINDKRVRRCKQIVEIVDIDPMTKEILTNEVFRWDPVSDQFFFSGKSYVMERIRNQHGMSKKDMLEELRRRVEILEWMKDNNIRAFKDVARIVSSYLDSPNDVMEKVRKDRKMKQKQPDVEVKNVLVEQLNEVQPSSSAHDNIFEKEEEEIKSEDADDTNKISANEL